VKREKDRQTGRQKLFDRHKGEEGTSVEGKGDRRETEKHTDKTLQT
jgi:hypothetical protein